MTDELNLQTFSPTVAELQSLVAVAREVDETNLTAVTGVRISLKSARVRIEKRGKEFRADAVKFQKAVIAKEHELIAIIEPEETRLEAIEEEVKAKKLREERIALLPERKAKLQDFIQDEPQKELFMSDEFLLDLAENQFQSLFTQIVSHKNEREHQKLEVERAEIEAEKQKLARDKELAEREEKTRVEERERSERVAKEERERQERLIREEREAADRRAKEAESRAVEAAKDAERRVQAEKDAAIQREKERIEREAKEARMKKFTEEAERKARENNEKYIAFMKKHGLYETTKENLQNYYILNDNTDAKHPKVRLYKLVEILDLEI